LQYLIPPWQHQLTAIERAKDMDFFALFFEMGAGKTMTAINILRHKINQKKRYLRTAIFCPPIVVPNWRDEFQMHSKMDPKQIVLLQGSGKKRLEQFKKAIEQPLAPVFVTNYEALLMDELYAAMLAWRPEFIVDDESHRLKNYKAQRSKRAEKLANPKDGERPFVAILSGSPVLNSPMDLFQQYLIMDGGWTFGKKFLRLSRSLLHRQKRRDA
jgi:SNF2 family DNA or RNA helicase